MGCDLGSLLAGSGLVLEAAFLAVLVFGSLANPLLQWAVAQFVNSMLDFANCTLMM